MTKAKTHTTRGLRPPKKHSSKHALKIYWPYIPMLLLLLGGLFMNVWMPLQSSSPVTLAYATEMTRSGLLSSTNSQRANNGAGALSLNELLNAAAQAKANDMVARNYWSHNTPDGQEPWVFIDAQGYSYTKAGENLAYGFSTSNATVIGWMNSPSHRANMLDTAFSEVGFGFANSSNFVSSGEQTIVVAMYGRPVVASAVTEPTPPPAPAPASTPSAESQASSPITQTPPAPTETTVAEEAPAEQEATPIQVVDDTVIASEQSEQIPLVSEPARITLLQQLTGGAAPWSAIIVSALGFGLALIWLTKHFVLVRRFVIEGEHFVAHHPILDLIVVAIVAAAVYLSQSSGVVL
jgi:hypothetical protein